MDQIRAESLKYSFMHNIADAKGLLRWSRPDEWLGTLPDEAVTRSDMKMGIKPRQLARTGEVGERIAWLAG